MSQPIASPMLSLPSDLRLLPVARAFVETFCQCCRLPDQLTDTIVLAADEAVNNAIRHAHQNDTALTVYVRCIMTDAHIEIEIEDAGEPFDAAAVPCLDPSELRVGGRGLFLIRTLMDEVHCCQCQPRGNMIRLIKRR